MAGHARSLAATGALLLATLGAAVSACTGGSGAAGGAATTATADAAASAPTFRLYLLSSVAGALEPCGCSKDQLGGAAHLAAFVEAEKGKAKQSLFLGAGPLFFQDPTITDDKRAQTEWKAEALADAAARLNLVAWAPAANDWAAGAETFTKLRDRSKASFLAANVKGEAGLGATKMVTVEGVKIAIVGVADPRGGGLAPPTGVEVGPALDALKTEIAKARTDGARIVIGLASIQRGEALRLVDQLPELDVLVVGKPGDKGDANDSPKPAVMMGDTLVVETSNHLQTIAVVDVFLREGEGSAGRIKLADAGGVAKAEQLVTIAQQIRELENRINGWALDKTVREDDLKARRADLERLRTEKVQLENAAVAPPTGSFFKYSLVEVRQGLGAEHEMTQVILGYYKRVNEHNKEAFKDRKPPPVAEDQAGYVGLEECSRCHQEERKVWDGTQHAHAYASVQEKFVEFNLDCVGCHVTGYEKPGGSTVTQVKGFESVQCEVCHGPGSLHAKTPEKKGLIKVQPEPRSCVAECHHPPHVEGFDPVAKMPLVLGPGHGR